ncbi:hypothetical protein LJK87_33750 [Paenibacillus sp. P25]|nr:hypothetical protein LJK87_33750 [Paenibacillus sp. P25]
MMNGNGWWILAGIVILAAGIEFVRQVRKRRGNSRVARLSDFSKKRGVLRQSRSFCKRKVPAKELSFYARHGKAIGVCKACRPQAERQALLRL